MSDYVTKTNLLSALGRFKENTDNLYGTKAEASDLKSAIDANSKRITNLEQKAGDEIVVNYPSSTYGMDEVPANVAEYAKVTKLRGVSRVENQLMQSWDFSTQYPWSRNSGTTTLTIANNKAIVTHDSTPSVSYDGGILASHYPMKVISGHTYLVCYGIKTSTACSMTAYFEGCGYFTAGAISANTQSKYMALKTATSSVDEVNLILLPNNTMVFGAGDTEEYSEVIIRDLNIYFGGTIPSDAQTIADIQQNYPELLVPSEYGSSLVSTTYEGVKSVGVNLVSGYVAENGYWYTGGWMSDNGFKSSVKIPVEYGKTYIGTIFNKQGTKINKLVYSTFANDSDSNAIRQETNTAITIQAGENFIAVRNYGVESSYITNNNYEYQLEVGSVSSSFHPYMTDPLSLPSPVELRSAGSVADTDELNVEVDGVERRRQTRRVGQVDGGTLDWQAGSTDTAGKFRFTASLPIAISQDANIVANILCTKYIAVSPLQTYRCVTGVSNNANNSQIIVYDESYAEKPASEFKEHVTGVIFNYELADPVVTLSDPVEDPFLKVEGGGTIEPVQSQSIKIDHAFTAEYLSLGA